MLIVFCYTIFVVYTMLFVCAWVASHTHINNNVIGVHFTLSLSLSHSVCTPFPALFTINVIIYDSSNRRKKNTQQEKQNIL